MCKRPFQGHFSVKQFLQLNLKQTVFPTTIIWSETLKWADSKCNLKMEAA